MTTVSINGLNEIEVSFALLFLVNLAEVYQELQPHVTNKMRKHKRSWFKSMFIEILETVKAQYRK